MLGRAAPAWLVPWWSLAALWPASTLPGVLCQGLCCVSVQVQQFKVTEGRINEARELYRPAAARAALLYFTMEQLRAVHPMYQFSLKVPALQGGTSSQFLSELVLCGPLNPLGSALLSCSWLSRRQLPSRLFSEREIGIISFGFRVSWSFRLYPD